jgi:NTE family protein
MRAFVLSGGGNRGALQVGALQVLMEHGVQPDLLVGTSAGALNAVFLASDPTLAGARKLAQVWENVTQADVYPGSRWSVLWRLLRNDESLYPNANFQRFLKRQLRASHVQSFGDIATGVRLYVVAAGLDTGAARVFGDDPHDQLLDALMASTALPPFHPPWRCDGGVYVDGAVAADLPIRIAIARGAREIFALQVNSPAPLEGRRRGIFDVTDRALNALLQQQRQYELRAVSEQISVKLHYVALTTRVDAPLWDFRHGAEMIAEGRAALEAYLQVLSARPSPKPESAWQRTYQLFAARATPH